MNFKDSILSIFSRKKIVTDDEYMETVNKFIDAHMHYCANETIDWSPPRYTIRTGEKE